MHSDLCSKTVLMLMSLKCGHTLLRIQHATYSGTHRICKTPHMFKEAGKGITNAMMVIGTPYGVRSTEPVLRILSIPRLLQTT